MSDSPKESPDPELDAAPVEVKKLSAQFVDTYFVTFWPGHVRIALGEELDGEDYYHMAIVLPTAVVEALAEQIKAAIERRRADGREPPPWKPTKKEEG
jgi:hypothetical protein